MDNFAVTLIWTACVFVGGLAAGLSLAERPKPKGPSNVVPLRPEKR